MNVGKLCKRPAVSVEAGAPLSQAAGLMKDRHVGAVIVTKAPLDRPVVVGIVTDRDIVHAQLDRACDLSSLGVEQVMTRDPLVLNTEDPLIDAIDRLRTRGVRRAPVIGSDGALVGLISTDDLLAEVAAELIGLARLVAQQPGREAA